MNRFRDILVIPAKMAPEDPALKRALALAARQHVNITVGWLAEEAAAISDKSMREAVLENERIELIQLVAPIAQQGISIQPVLILGRPYMSIIHRVQTRGYSLVIKTARGRLLEPSLFFGSTALHLLRKCPCPVWVVDDQGAAQPGPLLAAIDPANDAADARNLAETVLDLAGFLAERDKVPLHVLHAWTAPYEEALRNIGFLRMSETEIGNYIKKAEETHRNAFDGVMARHGSAIPHFVKGRADAVIVAMTRDLGITTLVMGTVARGGIPGLLVGNTAETVLAQVRCSVLAVKPPGFISPVGIAVD